jgi:hypothetical protein
MANEQNLTPWPPGTSGNPEGKKPGTKNMTTRIRELLETQAVDKQGNKLEKTYFELLVERVVEKAISRGDSKMIELIWNYVDGKPKGNIDLGFNKESLSDLTKFFRSMATPEDDEKKPE